MDLTKYFEELITRMKQTLDNLKLMPLPMNTAGAAHQTALDLYVSLMADLQGIQVFIDVGKQNIKTLEAWIKFSNEMLTPLTAAQKVQAEATDSAPIGDVLCNLHQDIADRQLELMLVQQAIISANIIKRETEAALVCPPLAWLKKL